MKKLFIVLMAALLASCNAGQQAVVAIIIPFEGPQKEACETYSSYLNAMASANWKAVFEFESPYLWPSLDEELYFNVRQRHPEFSSLLAKSTVEFSQCSKQTNWGVYGKTYEEAYILGFNVKLPEVLSIQERQYVDILSQKIITVLAKVEDKWKVLPAFGPELLDIENAKKAYETYLTAIIEGRFEDTYEFMPRELLAGATKPQVRQDWLDNYGPEIAKLAKEINIRPVAGRIEFGPDFAGLNYKFGVVFNLFLDFNKLPTNPQNAFIKAIVNGWRSQQNATVMLVFEDSWKVASENPLF